MAARDAHLVRTAVTALCALGASIGVIVLAAGAGDGPRAQRRIDRAMRGWARSWLLPAGARIEVVGGQRLESESASVIVSNHQSNLDPIVHLVALRVPLRFLAMRELFDVPVLGSTLRRIGMIEVDRSSPDTRAITTAVRRALDCGANVLIYPEGGTSGTGEVQAFRSGAFRLAIENQVAIVPVATTGTREIWPTDRHRLGPGIVRVHVGEPIPTAGLTATDAIGLRDQVHAWIRHTVGAQREGPAAPIGTAGPSTAD